MMLIVGLKAECCCELGPFKHAYFTLLAYEGVEHFVSVVLLSGSW